nr:WGR domain-containing protein [Gemmatimonadota bacterium]
MKSRRFEMSEGSSKKFWTIVVEGTSHTVTFGRLGSSGQSQSKSFATKEEALRSVKKLIAEKTRKGYRELKNAGDTPAPEEQSAAPAAVRITASPSPSPSP